MTPFILANAVRGEAAGVTTSTTTADWGIDSHRHMKQKPIEHTNVYESKNERLRQLATEASMMLRHKKRLLAELVTPAATADDNDITVDVDSVVSVVDRS